MKAASYSNCEDLEVIGALIYTGQDGGAKQLSALFGGSDAVRKLIVNHQINVRELLDKLTTALKYVLSKIPCSAFTYSMTGQSFSARTAGCYRN